MPATVSELAVGFAGTLRAFGLDAPVSSVVCFAGALAELGVREPGHVFWAGHASFVRRPEDMAAYAAAFSAYFAGRRRAAQGSARPAAAGEPASADREPPRDTEAAPHEPGSTRVGHYSPAELLRTKDFASCTDDELEILYRLMSSIRRGAPRRMSRRRAPVRTRNGSPDLRRTVREALRSGGEPTRLHRLGPDERERAVVLLVDVSGSMAPYARAFLHFAHAAVVGGRRVEAFALGTRLTRITRELSWRDPDAALVRAAGSVADIEGGTRLGEGMGEFNDRYAVAGMARGAVVVILSDGFDRGDPDRISSEMVRLKRVAHRLIWVNPLKASPGYEPLARGMAAALPFLDDFVEGHSVTSLEKLIEVMASPWN